MVCLKKLPKKNSSYNMADSPDNVIDFTLLRLKKLKQEYLELRMYDVVKSVEHAIDMYSQGKAKIKWKDGLPFVKILKEKEKLP